MIDKLMISRKVEKRVLILESDLLLTQGLISLLRSREDLEVKGVKFSGLAELSKIIVDFNPHVIVLAQQCLDESYSELLPTLMKYQQLRVVSFDPHSNNLYVYEKQEVRVKETADFFTAI